MNSWACLLGTRVSPAQTWSGLGHLSDDPSAYTGKGKDRAGERSLGRWTSKRRREGSLNVYAACNWSVIRRSRQATTLKILLGFKEPERHRTLGDHFLPTKPLGLRKDGVFVPLSESPLLPAACSLLGAHSSVPPVFLGQEDRQTSFPPTQLLPWRTTYSEPHAVNIGSRNLAVRNTPFCCLGTVLPLRRQRPSCRERPLKPRGTCSKAVKLSASSRPDPSLLYAVFDPTNLAANPGQNPARCFSATATACIRTTFRVTLVVCVGCYLDDSAHTVRRLILVFNNVDSLGPLCFSIFKVRFSAFS